MIRFTVKLIFSGLFFILLSCSTKDNPAPAPAIASISPQSGGVGTQVTITGSKFGATIQDNHVSVNDKEATITSASATQLIITVPELAGTGPVKVTTTIGTGKGPLFTYNCDVYVVGAERDQTGTMVAKYWKNGTPTLLTNTVNSDAFANAIFVSGNDVYVTGIDGAQGKYWKNGVATLLEASAMSNPEGKDILVLNNDVYVAGNKMTSNTVETAVVWKNGTGTTLTGTTYSSVVNAIATNGKDIFVVGDEFIDANNAVTKYWKNSVGVTIAQGGEAYDIAVDGNDVYVAGSVWNETKKTAMAVYWKNGTQKLLTDGTNYAKAVSIAVHNGDVFVLANELVSSKWTMEYWKNDVLVPVGRGTGSDIAIVGNDVYVVGGFANAAGIPVAQYWKNGVAINLSNGTYDAVAYGICLR